MAEWSDNEMQAVDNLLELLRIYNVDLLVEGAQQRTDRDAVGKLRSAQIQVQQILDRHQRKIVEITNDGWSAIYILPGQGAPTSQDPLPLLPKEDLGKDIDDRLGALNDELVEHVEDLLCMFPPQDVAEAVGSCLKEIEGVTKKVEELSDRILEAIDRFKSRID